MACIGRDSIDVELECVTDDPSHGDDELIPVMPSGRLCTNPYTLTVKLPGNLSCDDPKVDAAFAFPRGTPNHFLPTVKPGADAGTCDLTLAADATSPTFPQAYHVLLSFKGPSLRSTFVLGLQGSVQACGPVAIEPITPVGVCP